MATNKPQTKGDQMRVSVSQLKPGDFVVPASATVADKPQHIGGGLYIVDFDDNTATPPIPNVSVEIRR